MLKTRVGYTGGDSPHPTYHNMKGHTECVKIWFDPTVTSYSNMLKLFWGNHSACGGSTQYMSVIFYHNEEQMRLAKETKKERPKAATKILPAKHWTDAEEYHQKYIAKARGTHVKDIQDVREGSKQTRDGECVTM